MTAAALTSSSGLEPVPVPPLVAGARFLGWGSALPDRVLGNAELECRLDTTDRWITERTGIRERRIADDSETTAGLAVTAGARALACAGVDPAEVGLVVLATTTPDQKMPATAAAVQAELAIGGGACDLNAVCAGFVHGLHLGLTAVAAGGLGPVLVIGADRLTALVDPDDRGTAILFGDGAGAVVLAPPAAEGGDPASGPGLLGLDFGTDGTGRRHLEVPAGQRYLHMDGREVFRQATRHLVASCRLALDHAGLTPGDVDLLVPHQANQRIIDHLAAKLGVGPERVKVNLDRVGNTSAASVPMALAEAADEGLLSTGDIVLLTAIGSGLSWGSLVLRWGR